MHVVVFVLVSAVSASVSAQQQYCSICKQHTLCVYSSLKPGASCGSNYSTTVNASDIAAIVDAHNSWRSIVARGKESRGAPGPQPPAKNMRKMSWDTELATIAQRWAQQCTFAHDTCRNVARFLVGQNIALTGSSLFDKSLHPDWTKAVQLWYDEVALFDSKQVTPYRFSSTIGHYSQLVWASSYKVGCGYCYHKPPGSAFYSKFYVCNYGPAGNVVGAGTSMYDPGPAGSKCPNGTKPETKTGLCA